MASYTALAPILIALVTDIGPLLQPLALQFVYFNGKSFVKGAVNVVFCIQESVKYRSMLLRIGVAAVILQQFWHTPTSHAKAPNPRAGLYSEA